MYVLYKLNCNLDLLIDRNNSQFLFMVLELLELSQAEIPHDIGPSMAIPSLSSTTVPSSSSPSGLPSNLTLLISNLTSFVPYKLDSTYYIIWKKQFQNILNATKLMSMDLRYVHLLLFLVQVE